jgi:hypothetical protein
MFWVSATRLFHSSSSRLEPMQKPPPWIVRMVGRVCGEVRSKVLGKNILFQVGGLLEPLLLSLS